MVLLSREFIAVPDDKKNQIVFKWPDVNIRKFTRAIVDADEMALFVNTGQVVGTMGPGRHQIDAQELPFLGMFIDVATGGNAYRAELYFVGTREFPGFTFGGRIDDVQDPQTGMIVTLRVFGDYSLQVKDPAALITNLVGTVDVTNNETVAGWVSEQLLKVMRTEVTTQVVRNGWPILGLSVYTPDIEKAVIEAANNQLSTYGVALIRMGNFDVNLSDADEAQLKALAKDTAYSRLAGGFNRYAAGEMALGAGQGMAKGGGADQGAFLAAGLGLGGQMAGGVAGQGPGGEPGPVPPPGPGFAGGGGGFVGGGPAPGWWPGIGNGTPSCHCDLHQLSGAATGRQQVLLVVRCRPAPSRRPLQRLRGGELRHRALLRPVRAGPRPAACELPVLRHRSGPGPALLLVLRRRYYRRCPSRGRRRSVQPGPVQPGPVQPGAVQSAPAQDGGGQS